MARDIILILFEWNNKIEVKAVRWAKTFQWIKIIRMNVCEVSAWKKQWSERMREKMKVNPFVPALSTLNNAEWVSKKLFLFLIDAGVLKGKWRKKKKRQWNSKKQRPLFLLHVFSLSRDMIHMFGDSEALLPSKVSLTRPQIPSIRL